MTSQDQSKNRRLGLCRARTLVPLLSAVIALILALALPAVAAADGDPASDVLASYPLYLPQDAGTSYSQQSEFEALLAAAARTGFPIRVAVIASSADLGSVTELWRQPQTYSRFLGQELSYVYHGALLVVMPDGSALTQVARGASTGPGAASPVQAPAGVRGLVAVASSEVRALAAAAGHALPATVTAPSPKAGSADPIAWLVLVVGALLIGLAWAVSLRLRPLGSPAGGPHPTPRG
jgi:hypothetical protein